MLGAAAIAEFPAITVENQIEEFAALSGIKVERLLIVDISNTLSEFRSLTMANLLLAEPEHILALEERGKMPLHNRAAHSVGPWFLNSLAAPQHIAIVSRLGSSNVYDSDDLYQNIRHKCLVHFLYGDMRVAPGTPTSYGVHSFQRGRRTTYFTCGRNDGVLAWRENHLRKKIHECLESRPTLVKYDIKYHKFSPAVQDLTIGIFFRWNESLAELPASLAHINLFPSQVKNLFVYHTAVNNIVDMNHHTECYILLRIKRRDIYELLTPFSLGIWTIFLLNVTSLSVLLAFAARASLLGTVSLILLNFMKATSIGLKSKRSSHLVVCILVLFMNLIISNVYSDVFLANFLDPTEPNSVKKFVQCHLNVKCTHRAFTIGYMARGHTAVCGLSKVQLLTMNMPLHRVDFRVASQDDGHGPALYDRADSAHALFLKFNGRLIMRHPRHWSVPRLLVRSLNQKSVFFVRLFEHALIPSRALQPIRRNARQPREFGDRVSDKILSTYDSRLEGALRETFAVDGYLSSEGSRGCFEMENLEKLAPLFAVCSIICSTFLLLEKAKRRFESIERRMVRVYSAFGACFTSIARRLLREVVDWFRTQITLRKQTRIKKWLLLACLKKETQ